MGLGTPKSRFRFNICIQISKFSCLRRNILHYNTILSVKITILHPNLHWHITFSACDALLLIRIPYQGIWSHRSITSGEREYKLTLNSIRRLYHCIKRIFSFSPRQAPKIWTVSRRFESDSINFLKQNDLHNTKISRKLSITMGERDHIP